MSALVYAVVIESSKLKGQHPASGKDSLNKLKEVIFEKIYPSLSQNDYRQTLSGASVNVSFSKVETHTIFCVSTPNTPARIVWSFINDAMQEYEKLGFQKASQTSVNHLLAMLMKKWNDPANDKIAVLNEKIDEAKMSIISGIDKVFERGVKLEELTQSTSSVSEGASTFENKALLVKRSYRQRYLLLLLFLIVVILIVLIVAAVLLIIIVVAACESSPSKCSGNSTSPPINSTQTH